MYIEIVRGIQCRIDLKLLSGVLVPEEWLNQEKVQETAVILFADCATDCCCSTNISC